MFTGIIIGLGKIREINSHEGKDTRFLIEYVNDPLKTTIGASIACSGVCLTVVNYDSVSFSVDASAETLACTTLGGWKLGQLINLESALCIGDELGGHIVGGHVDCVAKISSIYEEGDSSRIVVDPPLEIMPYIAPKGSVTLDGISLTVNEVSSGSFGINVIPHTKSVTTLGNVIEGDFLNLEVDMLARYVARLRESEGAYGAR